MPAWRGQRTATNQKGRRPSWTAWGALSLTVTEAVHRKTKTCIGGFSNGWPRPRRRPCLKVADRLEWSFQCRNNRAAPYGPTRTPSSRATLGLGLLAQRRLTNRFQLEVPIQFPARRVFHRTPPQVSIAPIEVSIKRGYLQTGQNQALTTDCFQQVVFLPSPPYWSSLLRCGPVPQYGGASPRAGCSVDLRWRCRVRSTSGCFALPT